MPMATATATVFHLSNALSHRFFLPPFASPLPHFKAPLCSIPPALRVAVSDPFRRKTRRSTSVTVRAGPSSTSIAFAIALPLSLLAVTVLASIRIADKLDQQFYEEMAMNEAIMQADEDDDDDDYDEDDEYENRNNDGDDVETYAREEPALPLARNRPKREA